MHDSFVLIVTSLGKKNAEQLLLASGNSDNNILDFLELFSISELVLKKKYI